MPSLINEKGIMGSSPFCSSKAEKSMVRLSSLGGVPVLKRRSSKPRFFNESESPFAFFNPVLVVLFENSCWFGQTIGANSRINFLSRVNAKPTSCLATNHLPNSARRRGIGAVFLRTKGNHIPTVLVITFAVDLTQIPLPKFFILTVSGTFHITSTIQSSVQDAFPNAGK